MKDTHEKCAHKGCKKTTATASLFSVNGGKSKYCAEHLTPARVKTVPGEAK